MRGEGGRKSRKGGRRSWRDCENGGRGTEGGFSRLFVVLWESVWESVSHPPVSPSEICVGLGCRGTGMGDGGGEDDG